MDHAHMDHGNMDHGGMDHGGMDHGGHGGGGMTDMCNMNVSIYHHAFPSSRTLLLG